jgi:hypothetical protein
MMSTLENLIAPLRHSPLLPQIVEVLRTQIDAERLLRQSFYAEFPTGQPRFQFARRVFHTAYNSKWLMANHRNLNLRCL